VGEGAKRVMTVMECMLFPERLYKIADVGKTLAERVVFSIPLGRWRQTVRARKGSPSFSHGSRFQGSRKWFADRIEAERDRWVLWTPVGFACGIGGYFSLPVEPPILVGPTVLFVLVVNLLISRTRAGRMLPWLMLIVLTSGFAAAQIRTALVPDHLLKQDVRGLATGVVLAIEERPTGPRLTLGNARLKSAGGEQRLQKVRLSLRRTIGLPVIGQEIEIPAALRPPPNPSAPQAYDFRRAAFFRMISAVGYATGPFRVLGAPEDNDGLLSSARLWIAACRLELSRRIIEALPGASGALASALLTGERGPLPAEVLRVMRESGLAHLLAISGLHMGLVAGIVFFGIRAVLALSSRLTLGFPIKKWAALGALIFAGVYLVLSGAAVPTQRAFLMTGLVLIAVLLDREAISMRLVAWAAMVVLIFRPEALLTASFQLSFAAVTALVATYEFVAACRRARARGQVDWRGKILVYVGALLLTSIVANLATLPFSAYHFNQIASHGLASNMVAVPLAGFWIMPWGVLALALAPFGLEAVALTPMGWGLEILVGIAGEVSSWPGAVVRVAAWPTMALPLIGLAGAWLCLWRKPWRLAGGGLLFVVVSVALISQGPRIWVTGDGRLAGFLADDGRLLLSATSRERFTANLWLRMAGGEAKADWAQERDGVRCDDLGCVLHVEDMLVAVGGSGRALSDDCRRARIVITSAFARDCDGPERVFDHAELARGGGIAIWIGGDGIRTESILDSRGDRPWARDY
jgi:competence protein ComEC